MVANTRIKFFVHTNKNAPQLQNNYGSMISLLDACLVDGFNVGPVSSLTASGTTVTALFSSTHSLLLGQVIKITGANQQEFNGEHKIIGVPNSQSIIFELSQEPSVSTATGVIDASLPPLGWEKPFSSANLDGGGKAAYRSKNTLLPSRPFLRVVDELDPAWNTTYAKYAKVGFVEEMTDINTLLGGQLPYDTSNPDKNWVGSGSGNTALNGWCKWYYSRSNNEFTSNTLSDSSGSSAGNRFWLIVGTDEYFYILNSSSGTTPTVNVMGGAGHYKSFLIGNSNNIFLAGVIEYEAANTTSKLANYNGLFALSRSSLAVYSTLSEYIAASAISLGFEFNTGATWYTGFTDIAGGVKTLGRTLLTPYFLKTSQGVIGELPAIKFIPHNKPFSHVSPVITDGNIILPVGVLVYTSGSTNRDGQLAFDLGRLE